MGFLVHNLLHFVRLLRSLGLNVPATRMRDVVRALVEIDVGRREEVYHALRCLLVTRPQDFARFDEAFRAFWRPPPRDGTRHVPGLPGKRPRFGPPRVERDSAERASTQAGAGRAVAGIERVVPLSYSAREVLRVTAFEQLTAEEIAEARRMLAALRWELGVRRTRRWMAGRGTWPDLRRAARASIRYGGELVELPRRRRRIKRRPVVVICDVSGSMERYSRMLLHFIGCVAGGTAHVEAFLFATRLTRITRQLHRRPLNEVVATVPGDVPDFAGGTRIGATLKRFNMVWARRVLARGPVVLLISDGWDRGDPGLLGREMARLRRRCHRLIWLNPLLGSPAYRPLTRGMQAALPHIDDFLPVHNLESLEALARHLNRLAVEPAGPRRRHRAGATPAREHASWI